MNSEGGEEMKVDKKEEDEDEEMASPDLESPQPRNSVPLTDYTIYQERGTIESIDDIHERFDQGFYHSIDTLLEDVSNIVKKT